MRTQLDISHRILRSVAQREQCEVTDLDPLHTAVDPSALDEVVPSETGQEIEFTYHGYEIVVTSEGQIQITPAN